MEHTRHPCGDRDRDSKSTKHGDDGCDAATVPCNCVAVRIAWWLGPFKGVERFEHVAPMSRRSVTGERRRGGSRMRRRCRSASKSVSGQMMGVVNDDKKIPRQYRAEGCRWVGGLNPVRCKPSTPPVLTGSHGPCAHMNATTQLSLPWRRIRTHSRSPVHVL